jgi:hypothetical protein
MDCVDRRSSSGERRRRSKSQWTMFNALINPCCVDSSHARSNYYNRYNSGAVDNNLKLGLTHTDCSQLLLVAILTLKTFR